ncbi:MAG: serine/threonine-protein kinase [Myxococcota bacterium]
MLQRTYQVLRPIGVGGFGRVVQARASLPMPNGSELVAIKRLKSAKAQRKGTEESFRNEALIGQYLSHPNVVKVFEFIRQGKYLLMVMEFIQGVGVDDMLALARERRRAIPLAIAVEVIKQAAEGLYHAHSALTPDLQPLHIVHRDVKPSNIMVGDDGVVRVMDFGVARWSQPRVNTTTGTIKGTLRYLSPEQARGSREIGAASDQFALGLVLAEMVMGHPVYEADHDHKVLLRALKVEVRPALEELASHSLELAQVLRRCFRVEPSDRFESVRALREALEQVPCPPCEHTLAQWAKLCREERTALATRDPERWGLPLEDITQEEPEEPTTRRTQSPRREDPLPGHPTGAQPVDNFSSTAGLGWIHDHFPSDELVDSSSGSGGDWLDVPDSTGEKLPPAPKEPEQGWALVQDFPDEHDASRLRRDLTSDEWMMNVPADVIERRARHVTDLSAERELPRGLAGSYSGAFEVDFEPPGGAPSARGPASQVNTAELLLSLLPPFAGADAAEEARALEALEAELPRRTTRSYADATTARHAVASAPAELLAAVVSDHPPVKSESEESIQPAPAAAEPSPTHYSVQRPGGDRFELRRRPRALRFAPTVGQRPAEQDSGQEAASPEPNTTLELPDSAIMPDEDVLDPPEPEGLHSTALHGRVSRPVARVLDTSSSDVHALILEDDEEIFSMKVDDGPSLLPTGVLGVNVSPMRAPEPEAAPGPQLPPTPEQLDQLAESPTTRPGLRGMLDWLVRGRRRD